MSISRLSAVALFASTLALALACTSRVVRAQNIDSVYVLRATLAPGESTMMTPAAATVTFQPEPWAQDAADDDAGEHRTHFKTRMVLGFISSILAHEAGHVIASYAVGSHPSFGFDKGRPTVYSGLDASVEPHKQFIFSSAGLTVQTLMDELILDIPHARGGAFERGLLAGGIATTAFYITLGRNANVSDVTFMARTSSLTKSQVSLIFGAIAASHVLRIHLDDHYAHFFAAPTERGSLKVGMMVR